MQTDLALLPQARSHLRLFSRTRAHRLTLVALTCVGFALRVVLLDTFPLREDEAVYGFWARSATTDPFFLHTWPDKPPIFIWLLQGAFALLGPSAATARLVSIFASTLTIPLVAWGASTLWRSHSAALLAALLFTFSPYAVSFAPTAYTDSLLAMFGLAAVVCALRGRGLAAGLWLAAACMTKQQGVLYVPLVVGLLAWEPLMSMFAHWRTPVADRESHAAALSPPGAYDGESRPQWPARAERGFRFRRNDNATASGWAASGWATLVWALLGATIITLPILWWDSQRWAVAPSPWALAPQTYAPLAWLPPTQWWARTVAWAEWVWYLGGSWSVWAILAAALLVALVVAARQVRVALVVGWGIAFIALHIVASVQVWDRYLLPLAGWLALVASGPLAMVLARRRPDWGRGVLVLLLIIGMAETVVPGVDAAQGRLPIGGDHGDYAGLTEALAWVQGECAPPEAKAVRLENNAPSMGLDHHTGESQGVACRAILYHQVLGWHFRFYLYDTLQAQGDDPPRYDLRWFPSAAYLADNAAKTPYPPKYLIVPEWATPRDLDLHLALRALRLELRMRMGRFAVMEIVQPPQPACDWCKSSAVGAGMPFGALPLSESTAPAMSKPSASIPSASIPSMSIPEQTSTP